MIRFFSILTALVAVLLLTPPGKVSAIPGGLLNGKPGYYNGNINSVVTQATDNNTSTEIGVRYNGHYILWYLDKPYNIYRLYMNYRADSGGYTYRVDFMDAQGNQIGSKTFTWGGYLDVSFPSVSRVRVYNPQQYMSFWIREFDVFGTEGPPAPPANLRATATPGQVVLTWDPVEAVTGYHVYMDGVKITSSPITETSYAVTGLTDNVTYTWQVTSIRGGDESDLSAPITTYVDTIPPAKPEGLFARTQKGQIILEWIANRDDTAGYYVYRNGVRITPEPVVGTTYTASGLDGMEYVFQVSAVDRAGNESDKSDPVTVTMPDMTPPAAPTGLRATGEVGRVKLTWNANSEPDLAGYIVYRNGVRLNQEPIQGTIYYVYGLSYGIGYDFQVSAVDQAGNESEKSNVAKAAAIKPEDTTPPATPTGLTAALGSDALHIDLSWNANSEPDLAGYNLYVSLDGLTWQKVNADPITGTEYQYSPIEGRTTYFFRLSALDEAGNESKPTREVRIKTPSREVDPDVENTPPKLIITWSPVPGAVQYLIYYQGRLYAVVPSSVTQYEITLEDGYDPEAERQNVVVKARFLDGSIGEDPPDRTGQRWGFGPGDVFKNSMWLVGSIAGFVLFGIVIMYAPHLIRIIKDAAMRRKGANV